MKALITGASNGIGKDMALKLSELGYELILVARSEDKLKEVCSHVKTKCSYFVYDLSVTSNCLELYDKTKGEDIDVLINNAGFGLCGEFISTSLEDELNMIDLNIKCTHILMKLFLKDFVKKNRGYILNVDSSAGLLSGGPLLSTYYASKSYVYKLSIAVYEELRRKNSGVSISVLCPGPVDTGFNKRAGTNFSLKGVSSKFVADYAIDNMFKKKFFIIPETTIKFLVIFKRFLSEKLLTKLTYYFQNKKL